MAVTKFAQHGLVRLGYEIQGERDPTVLVLHGLLQTRGLMRPIADALEDHGTMITMDLRGHGGSSAVHGLDLRISDLADDAFAVLDAAEIDSTVVVVGVELGAIVASAMQLAQPDRVRGVVLVNHPTDDMLDPATLSAIGNLAYREQVEQAMNRWLDMSWGKDWKETVARARVAAARRSAQAIHPMLTALSAADAGSQSSLQMPGGAPFDDESDVERVVAEIEKLTRVG